MRGRERALTGARHFACGASALLPLLGGLKGAIMSLGASAAMATGGLTVVAGAVALLVANMGGVDEEAKKQTEEIKKLDEQYKQLNNDIQQIIIKNAEFRKSLQATLGGIRELEQEFIEQELELQFKLGKISHSFGLKTPVFVVHFRPDPPLQPKYHPEVPAGLGQPSPPQTGQNIP